jgi:glutathione S-transferase
MSDPAVTLFHAPHTRSSGVLFLLEELKVPYKLHILDQKAGEHRAPAFLAVNPMGKVPALLDGTGAVVTEQVAIMLHLADLFPAAELAPPVGDPLRGPYLRWMVFYAGAFEPAVVDRAAGREPAQRAISPYGEFDTALNAVVAALVPGPYLLGDRFSAADVLWGTALSWTTQFKLVPERPEIADYISRIGARPAAQRARERDAAVTATG